MKEINIIFAIFLIIALGVCPPVKAATDIKTDIKYEKLQLIRLINIIKIEDKYIVGTGYANLNNGSSMFFWSSTTPPTMEISFNSDKGSFSAECKKIFDNNDYPKQILAYGNFNSRKDGDINFTGEFKISNILSCEAGKEVEKKDPSIILRNAFERARKPNKS